MKQCFIGAQPCQNLLIYHASSANTCLFFYKPLAPIWPPIHQQKPECTHSPGGGITGYLLSDMTFELNRRLVDRLALSPTLGATGLLLHPAQQRTKSPHSDWTRIETQVPLVPSTDGCFIAWRELWTIVLCHPTKRMAMVFCLLFYYYILWGWIGSLLLYYYFGGNLRAKKVCYL